jgi:hypothetical protein|tara:strand:- start:3065 stop:3289 length:225 start_codon:yes stop_codon:yes gene_type:complete
MKVEYWSNYSLVKVEEWADTDESFKKFYHLNNQLKYCNGSHYKFVSDEVQRRYNEEFIDEYNTIENYYQGGIVD